MALNLSILYRGPLSSCNYGCDYCPFAKRHETAAELAVDRRALLRFVDWLATHHAHDRVAVLFTPWGEALTRRWYRDALIQLSHMPHIERAAIQTNLSCPLDWIEQADTTRLALWATYHPSEVTRETFVSRCRELDQRGVMYSVGVVGLKEHREEIEALRRELSPNTYLWINAYKRDPAYYTDSDLQAFEAIDPLFPINNLRHTSLGKSCRTGRDVISVDGDGTMRRCHFIRDPIGNLYDTNFESALVERTCTNDTCSCHIGYVHLDDLNLRNTFGPGILERIPVRQVWRNQV